MNRGVRRLVAWVPDREVESLGCAVDPDEDLVAEDAPYVMESSESEAPPSSKAPKRPAKKRMLNMAGRAKRFVKSTASKLSKSDRIHFWNNKAGAAPSNDG